MDFKDEFIKCEVHEKDMPFDGEDVLGIKEHLKMQWETDYKAMGMVSRDTFLFGWTEDFSLIHNKIIDDLRDMIEEPTIMLAVQGSIDKVYVYINPIHTSKGAEITSEFEYEILKQFLSECESALDDRPEYKKFQLDIEPGFLDTDNAEYTRARNKEQLRRIEEVISQPKKPKKEVVPETSIKKGLSNWLFDEIIKKLLNK